MTNLALVTGVPGWLGTRFVRTLAEGLPDVPEFAAGNPERVIRCLVLPGQDVAPLKKIRGKIEVVEGSVSDPAAVERLFAGASGATVFHAAGVIHPTRGVKQFYEVNEQGARNMVAAAAKAKVRRFVHVSSNSPIGTNPNNSHVFTEDAPYNPYMNYGRSKMLAEQVVRAAHGEGKIDAVVIRPPWFYGPDQPERQTRFFTMIKKGKMPIVGGGENQRSMAYVDNICQGLMLCEKVERASGGVYWIADARPYTMNEIVQTIAELLRDDFGQAVAEKPMRLPGIVSEIAWVIDYTLQALGLYNQEFHVLSEMNKNIACSIDKARNELGYNPRVDLREGMRRSIQSILDSGNAAAITG